MLDPALMITTTMDDALSIRHANESTVLVADQVFTPHIVTKETVKVWQYDGSSFRVSTDESDSKSEAAKIDFGGFTSTKTLTLKKLSMDVDPNDEAQVDKPISDLMTEAKMTIMDRLMLAKEVRAASKATTAANYPSDLTSAIAAGSTWGETGGDPRSNARVAKAAVRQRTGKDANALVISKTSFDILKLSPALLDHMKYTSGQSLSIDILKNLLELEYLFIGGAVKNANVEGNATQTLSDVWNDSAVFFIHDPTPRLKTIVYGIQPVFNTLYSYVAEDPKRGGPKGRVQTVEMGLSYSLDGGSVVSNSDSDFTAGYLFTNAT